MAAPTIYKSTDDNAPVLVGNNRACVCDILNKCLVAGFGDKAAAGWTMPYSNIEGTRAVFRPDPAKSTGFFLQIDAATPAGTYEFIPRCYELMTGENDGVFPFGSGYSLRTSFYSYQSDLAVVRPWILVAGDDFVFFVMWPYTTGIPTPAQVQSSLAYRGEMFFFGDLVSLYPDDSYRCMLSLSRSETSSPGSRGFGLFSPSSFSTESGQNTRVARGAGGVGANISVTFPIVIGGNLNLAAGQNGEDYSAALGLRLSRLYVNNGQANSLRGFVPRLWVPLHATTWGNCVPETIEGRTYMPVYWRLDNSSNTDLVTHVLLDLTEE